jgi:oligoribonuclease
MPEHPTLLWVDLEMTGLDPESCAIVELASLVTTDHLELVAEGPCLVVHQSDEVLAAMSDAVREMHTRSGLLELVRGSTVTLRDAEAELVAFVGRCCGAERPLLCGNSVWKDRAFLERYMPELARRLHYRMIDVSTVKELARRWYGPRGKAPEKAEHHRALDDIRESMAELRWYREELFVPPASRSF